MPKQLVAVDVHVADYQKLIDQLGDQYRFLLLTSESDPLGQLADFVSANPGFDAIHLISHGALGQIQLGSQTISGANVGSYADQLQRIGQGVRAGGDFLLYGCDVAQGVGGQQLITDLSRLTRLDVAASTNETGSTGDWVLERVTGPIGNSLPEIRLSGDLAAMPTIAWTRLIGSAGTEYGSALTTGLDGSIYLTGFTGSTNFYGQANAGSSDWFITKIASDGTTSWSRLNGSTGDDQSHALTTGLDGSIYVAGETFSSILDGKANAGFVDTFVTKYAPDGTKAWTQLIGSTAGEQGYALTTGLDGAIYVAGLTSSANLYGQTNAGVFDAFVTKLLPDGTKTWTKLIGSTGSDYGHALTTGLGTR